LGSGKALLIGIDHYRNGLPPLSGCVNDATRLEALLSRNEDNSVNFDCKQILSTNETDITGAQLEESTNELLQHPDELALLHFSGHGQRDDKGSRLVAQDGSTLRTSDLLKMINESSARQVVVFLDCCFSGGLGTTDFIGEGHALLHEGRALMVASRASEAASEVADGGVFSTLLTGGLDGGAADVLGVVTVAGLYSYLDEALGAWDQRPLLKANLTTLARLRQCEPLVPLETLRMLPKLFPNPDFLFPLDPSHEPDERYPPVNKEHEQIFKRLQQCNRMRLVDPVEEEHMFYAAVNSTGCRLTQLGKRYWRRAYDGRI
jgi:hypothetical protein